MSNEFKFQPSAVAEAVSKKVLIERLPEWMQSIEHIQMYFDNAIQPWFTPEEQELVDGYIGDRGSPAATGRIFLSENDVQREEYQLSPAYVARNTDKTVRSLQFYPDLVGYLSHYGAIAEDESRLFDGHFYSWTPAVNPNKLMNFSSYVWDSENEYGILPDYVVMQRGAANGNTWSLQNFWYTVGDTLPDGTVLSQSDIISTRFTRAAGPIIEFNKNIELVNYGSSFRSVVDYYSDSMKPEDIAQRRLTDDIRVDGNVLKEGDRILFTSIGNSGENNRIYKIHVDQMDDGTRVYGITLDVSEFSTTRPTGEALEGDVVLVRNGSSYANSSFYWNGSVWNQTQVKSGINTFPSFVLYDKDGVALSDKTKYPNSTFSGSNMFGFKINYDYSIDSVYGYHIEQSDNNYYIYENFLQTQRFNYTDSDTVQEIPGLYYYKLIDVDSNGTVSEHLKTDWVRSTDVSKQYVRQVPALNKISMFKVFSTMKEMEQYSSPLVNMYAYVTDLDSNFVYDGSKWNEITTDAIQSDIYETKFDLAQLIDPQSSTDDIEIVVDGVVVTDYNKVLNSDGLISSVDLVNNTLTSDSIVTIRTYSTNTPDKTMGAYEVPINLKNNPFNDIIDYIHQGEYTLHFNEIIQKNITSGNVNDFNDYEERLLAGEVNNAVGTYIIQNEVSLFPLMISSANENLDIFKALQFTQQEYFRFKNRFNSRMLSLYDADPAAFNAMAATTIVDTILNDLNLGKDSTFPFYTSTMGVTTTIAHPFIPVTPQFLGMLKTYEPESMQYLQIGSSMSWYNIDHTGSVSKSYYVLNGITLMDEVVLNLETRIYDSINSTFKDVDYIPVLDSTELKPTAYYQNTDYTASEYDTLSLRGFVNFSATNGIDSTSHEYRQGDWTTWNYTGSTYVVDGNPTTIPARGSWRGIYMDMFGTCRPHSHPWEMLGFSERPSWWNLQYEATRVQVGTAADEYVTVYTAEVKNENGNIVPSGLWDVDDVKGDISQGIILEGTRAGTYSQYRRFGKQPFTINSTGTFAENGQEIMTVELISPDDLGMVSGALSHLSEPWAFGDMGEIEYSYMNTPMYCFDKAAAMLRAKPAQFMSYYFDIANSVLQTIDSNNKQFLYNDTRDRLSITSSSLVHGESGTSVLGWQQWISEYLVWQNKDVTKNFGNVLRLSYINIGHRIGAFTKIDQLQFSTETYGNISQENQYIGLVKSSVIKSANLSAVKITYTGTSYTVSGYDLVNPYFTVSVPNQRGKRSTITIGKKRMISYGEYKSGQTSTVAYGTEFKSIQDIYTFLCSYGQYLTDQGWIFEESTEDGTAFDWKYIAYNFVQWVNSSPAKGDFLSLTTAGTAAKFGTTYGSVENVTQFSGGVWSLLDDQNAGIRPDEIDTVRIGNVFSIRTLDDSDKRMALIRLNINTYEHGIVFDDTTIFGDSLYIPKYGSIYEMIKMYGYVTGQWNGRLEAPGFIILETGTLPNFEKLVNDFTKYYDNSSPVDNSTLRKLSRHLIGFQTRDYLSQMITNESSQVDFYRGFIAEKGTKQAFEKVLRVSKSYNTENYKALEEWAFKLGEYGNVDGKKHLQFQMINNEFSQEPQLFINDVNATEEPYGTSIVHYGKQGDDSRWVARPKGKFSFPVRTGRSKRINLPDIGPVTLPEVDYSTVSFDTAYASRAAFEYQMNKDATKVWMFRDDESKWNIFNIVSTNAHLLRIEPITYEGVDNQYAQLTFFEEHGLDDGDWYFLRDPNGYMPDILEREAQFFSVQDDKTIIVPLALANSIIFSEVPTDDVTVSVAYNDIRINASNPLTSVDPVSVTMGINNIRIDATDGGSGEITTGTALSATFQVGGTTESTTLTTNSIRLDATTGGTAEITEGAVVSGTLVVSTGGSDEGSADSGEITIGDEHTATLIVSSGDDNGFDLSVCPVLYKYSSRFSTEAQRQNYSKSKYVYEAPESSLFERPSTYNSVTNEAELYMNIFDPINGMIPGTLMTEIKYISSYDPATYNSDNTYNTKAWGPEKKGLVWWDTTNAFYLDYTRPLTDDAGVIDVDSTNEYKRVNWGKLLPGYSIDVYEWVQSPVAPYEWDSYVEKQAKLNKNSSSWVASGTALEDDYSVFDEYNEDTQTYTTYYYFWVKGSIYVPEVKTRSKSVSELARCIADPSLLEIPWFSPISDSAFITSKLQDDITDDKSILTIIWQMDETEVVKHTQYQLCQEGLDYNFNPVVWDSLWNSMIGQETTSTGEVVELLYPDVDFGSEPGKTWFEDVLESRRELVQSANNVYRTINITTDTVLMSDVFNMQVNTRNPSQVDFSVLQVGNEYVISAPGNTYAENDIVVLSTTGVLPSPLSTANVYFVHLSTDGYLRLMNSQSTVTSSDTIVLYDKGEGQHSMVLQSEYDASLSISLDMTKFWDYADWYADGYSSATLYSQEDSTAAADLKNYLEGDVIRVVGEDNTWTLYVKTLTRDKYLWSAVGRQNSTVALNTTLYEGYSRYDSTGAQTDDEKLIRQALQLLKTTFDTVQSRVVFDMLKYAHKEQSVIDWAFKTSYIYIVGLEQSLQQSYLQTDDLITQIVEYFNEVKPYHTKIRSQIEQKTSDDDEVVGVANDLSPNGYVLVDGEYVKNEKDIWDYEYATQNSVTGKWEITGALPDDFVTPDRSFQEMDVQMYFDNIQAAQSSDLVDSATLQAVNNKYVTTANDLPIEGTNYKLSRFSFDVPVLNSSVLDNSVKSTLVSWYPAFDSTGTISDGIATLTEGMTSVQMQTLFADLATIYETVLDSDSSYVEYKNFSQYNTLVNRLKLYSSMTDDQIAESIQSTFKGRVIDDNTSTRLPGGYSSSSDKNYGYFLESKGVYTTIRDKVVDYLGSSASDTEIDNYMRYEYGLYPWFRDIEDGGQNYTDALYVLAAVRNLRNIEDADPMEDARSILQHYYQTAGEYALVMIPRKYFKAKSDSGVFSNIPVNTPVSEYLEDLYYSTKEIYALQYDNLNDIPVDEDNPLYSTYMKVLESVDGTNYVNDLNAYDSSGYEDQYKSVFAYGENQALPESEPQFIDISELNPNAEELSELKFTIHGYNFSDQEQQNGESLRNIGVGSVQGGIVMNPYNKSEVLVSIPRYSEALSIMDQQNWESTAPKFLHKVHAVNDVSGILSVPDHDLLVGEKVAIFTPGGEDYEYQNSDGSWTNVLKVQNIQTGTRPTLFEITAVTSDTVTIDGLVLENVIDISNAPGITLFRVTSFCDDSFIDIDSELYMTERRYTVSMLNYDLFYDRIISGSTFDDTTEVDEFDGWYTTNEFTVLQDGTEVDNGFYIPQHDEGSLSELVRTKVTESVIMTFIEYDSATINPVMNDDGTWSYSQEVVDDVYISTAQSNATLMYTAVDINGWNVVVPEGVDTGTIENDKVLLTAEPEFGDVLLYDAEMMLMRYNSFVQRGIHNSAQYSYDADTAVQMTVLKLGNESDMETYVSGSSEFDADMLSKGMIVSSDVMYKGLLNLK